MTEKKIVRIEHEGVPLDVDLSPADPGPEWDWPAEPGPRLGCGCPLDSGCDGRHPGALGSASGMEP